MRDTPLFHPAWTILTPILPPPAPLPTAFTPSVAELGLASLQSCSQSTTQPPRVEINWFCVCKPLTNGVKAQRCHILLWPVRGRVPLKGSEMCNCIKSCVILKTHSPPRWWILRAYAFSDESGVAVFLLKLLKPFFLSLRDASNCRFWFKRGLAELGKRWLTLQVADNEFRGEGDNRLALSLKLEEWRENILPYLSGVGVPGNRWWQRYAEATRR